MEEGVEEYPLTGFDPEGEPVVRHTATGRLWLCVEFVPPSWASDDQRTGSVGLGVWADLGRKLACATGLPVVWEDREWFRIDEPNAGTVAAIHRLLLRERQWRDPGAVRPGPPGRPERFAFNYFPRMGSFAGVKLGIGGRPVTFEAVAAWSDPLRHFAEAVLRLTAGRAEDEVGFEVQARGEYLIDLRRAGTAVELAVWKFDSVPFRGDPWPPGRLVLGGWCPLRQVRERVAAVLERLLAKPGPAVYHARLEQDFPLDELTRLRQVAAGSADAEPGAAADPAS